MIPDVRPQRSCLSNSNPTGMASRVAMYPVNRNPGCSGRKVANTAANITAAIASLPISPSHPARSRLLALLPARGDITRAARNAFGTTPISPPNKVGIARSAPNPIHTIAASPTAAASCASRMLRTVRMDQSRTTKTPRGLPAVRGVFTLRNKPQRRPKTARIIEGRHPAYNREKPEKPLSLCGVRRAFALPPAAVAGSHVLRLQLDGKPLPDARIGVRRDVGGVVLREDLMHPLVRALVDGPVARFLPGSRRRAIGQLRV